MLKRWRSARSLHYASKDNLTVFHDIKIEDEMIEINRNNDDDDDDDQSNNSDNSDGEECVDGIMNEEDGALY